jgi:hypothetical protein
MKSMRKVFAWFFAFLSVICLFVTVDSLRWIGLHDRGAVLVRRFLAPVILISFAYLFAMAWWTTWKDKPWARVWGTAASLANLCVMLQVMHAWHRPMTNSRWEIIAVTVFALIAYAWPDPDDAPLTAEHIEEGDTNSQ